MRASHRKSQHGSKRAHEVLLSLAEKLLAHDGCWGWRVLAFFGDAAPEG